MERRDAYLEKKKAHRLHTFGVIWRGNGGKRDEAEEEDEEEEEEEEEEEDEEGGPRIEMSNMGREWMTPRSLSQRLKSWFRNNTGVKARKAARQKPLIDDKSGRKLRPHEMYSHLHYDQLRAEIAAEIKAQKISKKDALPFINQRTKEAWEAETDDVKEAVMRAVNAQNLIPEVEATPEAYARAIDEIPARLEGFFGPMAKRSGWSFSVIFGGPNPLNNGRIETMSYHHGKNDIGLTFSGAHPTYQTTYLEPFHKFLKGPNPFAKREHWDARVLL
ncbi:hypothetical protein BD779DRAFT_1470087 [Infundibulicybe gibba]|nr:hypothetical protein BD779DRAFT_1470087 [Infundibulicybe gibba]